MPFLRIPVKTNTEYREGSLGRMGHSAKGERNHGKGTMSPYSCLLPRRQITGLALDQI